MKHQDISVGMSVALKIDNPYGISAGPWEVVGLKPRPNYTVPFVVVRSNRPEGGILYFKPSEIVKVVA